MHNVIIIGSGPAGLTAAIYAARAQIEPLVIEGLEPGGQLTTTTVIENWPGAPDGIDGPELMLRMRKQAEQYGAAFLSGAVETVGFTGAPFGISAGGRQLQARCVIIATGATPRLLGLEAEKKLMGRGVSVCATCDGFFFRGKRVLVVGGGDTAMEEALYLSRLAASVTVVHRRDELRASKIMQQKAFDTPGIAFVWNSIVTGIRGADRVTGVTLKSVTTGALSDLDCDGVFMALGHLPNTGLFQKLIDLDGHGFIVTSRGTATSIPGIFAAGDATDPTYKQAVTAAGMGCMAALDAERYLRGL